MKLVELITEGYKPRKMTRSKAAGEAWLLIKDLEIFIVWNHGRDEFTIPVLIGYTDENN